VFYIKQRGFVFTQTEAVQRIHAESHCRNQHDDNEETDGDMFYYDFQNINKSTNLKIF
jgi:hypothetical protein